MFSIRILVATVLLTLLSSIPATSFAVDIAYGTVKAVEEVAEEDSVASGALVGGLLGAVVGGRDPGLNRGVVAGAAAGAAIDHAGQDTHFVYTVKLTANGERVNVKTEQDGIRMGDCVVLERGDHVNIRSVSSVHCEQPTQSPPEHHANMANQCNAAKQQLVDANTEDAINAAVQKVRVLCED
jgi:outer membrane lipoprotein SlyB